ncbi:glutamine synthetase family protein [Streptomyces sp. WI04-05B]|uniref:Glutamine synthetase n=1 Tax=Streptomyces turgidiscabies (strain Car8) TaxID=698760 RepID=L7F472_STRT8|nr:MULTISPECIES: glutamine synthetase family protein [Streptomyces]ELP65924.1 glutamine synthetase [Streptomyces turgidiscabies Car8]MDX2549099.1 glutamine synthetase family protein [Streptomyces sp. WI04-05B]MDX2590402.1 glutamine synthetase family protein [Streptomyces sp. WI04-05A]MDX3499856.1 glutamine synthetase family protein [Streptomyces turgidiscabies]GAQ75973.1 glutamine synthetase [Streptomyces turgidiscabies]
MAAGKSIRPNSPWLSGAVAEESLGDLVEKRRITEIVLGITDMQGRLKGKVYSAPVFLERMTGGAEMCSYILATDADMTPLEGFELTGWKHGYGDFLVKPDLSTARMLSSRPGTALVIGTPVDHDDTPVRVDPRHMLRTQLKRMRELGYEVRVGVESEFVLFSKEGSGLVPAWSENLDYALNLPPAVSDFCRNLSDAMTDAGIPYEAIKPEGAPGQFEVTFAYGDALAACDHYAVFRLLTRNVAGRDGLVPAFMAAPQTGIGSGLHLHLSLWSEHDDPGFAHHRGDDLPPLMMHAIAGLTSVSPDLAPLYAPTPNSYKRYRPYSFAPTRYNWGIDQRGCAVRVTGHGTGTHLEVRLAGADANAYLALTAYIAAMAHGIEEKLTPRLVCQGDAYQDGSAEPVYADLAEALQHFEHSPAANSLLGKDVVQHYGHAAHAELDWHRKHVTDTERHRGIR